MNNYRFSKKRAVLLVINLTAALYLFYNGVDSFVRGISLAVSVLCVLSLADNLFGDKSNEISSNGGNSTGDS